MFHCSMLCNICSMLLSDVKCRGSHICLSQTFLLSEIASVRCCLSQTLPLRYCLNQTLLLSDIPSVRHCLSETYHLSDTASVRHCLCWTLPQSDIASGKHNLCQTLPFCLNCLIFLFFPSYPCTTRTLYFVINPISVSPALKF